MLIKDYPKYHIFRNGAVLSEGFDKHHRPRFLKHSLNQNGYMYVNLYYAHKKARPVYIHRLLATHFIDNPENKRCVDHIDRNRKNNKLTNLRWATSAENSRNVDFDNKKISKNNTTGHKNITKTKKGYRFVIARKGIKQRKRFKTLEEAIEYKEEYLSRERIIKNWESNDFWFA